MDFLDMKECRNTHRILTEWFEYPEFTPEQIMEMARAQAEGHIYPDIPVGEWDSEQRAIATRISMFASKHKKRKWVNNMSQQEVAYRMNEASKRVSPENHKFLSPEVQERTGLELNPLWQMECLIRGGLLSAKEQIAALKELAAYTHSKAPSINHNTNTNMNPEDWLLELAKDEYKVLGQDIPLPNVRVEVEKGSGANYENRLQKRLTQIENLADHGNEEFERLAAEVDAEWIEVDEG
jgi:hypothetical protein